MCSDSRPHAQPSQHGFCPAASSVLSILWIWTSAWHTYPDSIRHNNHTALKISCAPLFIFTKKCVYLEGRVAERGVFFFFSQVAPWLGSGWAFSGSLVWILSCPNFSFASLFSFFLFLLKQCCFTLQHVRLGEAKAWSRELHPGFPQKWQRPTDLCHPPVPSQVH